MAPRFCGTYGRFLALIGRTECAPRHTQKSAEASTNVPLKSAAGQQANQTNTTRASNGVWLGFPLHYPVPAEVGFTESRNVTIECRFADGQYAKMPGSPCPRPRKGQEHCPYHTSAVCNVVGWILSIAAMFLGTSNSPAMRRWTLLRRSPVRCALVKRGSFRQLSNGGSHGNSGWKA